VVAELSRDTAQTLDAAADLCRLVGIDDTGAAGEEHCGNEERSNKFKHESFL
jgi:prophage antirepressor-like protein